MKNSINFNAINQKIIENLGDLQSGEMDVCSFASELYDEYMMRFDTNYDNMMDETNPYLDVIFAMFEINNIEID